MPYGRFSTAEGKYVISGGTLQAGTMSVGTNSSLLGTLTVRGNIGSIHLDSYAQLATGTLISEIDSVGLSTIAISGNAALDGDWEVVGLGAGFGRLDVLTATTGIIGGFDTVSLPDGDWSWGIENGTTLWVEHIPEPATVMLLAIGGLAILRRRRS